MIGLLFLGSIALTIGACVWIARSLGNLAPSPRFRTPLGFGIFFVLLSLPFVDEVIGKYQFEALCKANGIESVDVSKARGKRVKLESGESKSIDGFIMPITEYPALLRGSDSGEVLVQYKNYFAHGGWLMRYTWLSMGSEHPMLFSASCATDYVSRDAIFIKNSIFLIN